MLKVNTLSRVHSLLQTHPDIVMDDLFETILDQVKLVDLGESVDLAEVLDNALESPEALRLLSFFVGQDAMEYLSELAESVQGIPSDRDQNDEDLSDEEDDTPYEEKE